MESQAIVPCWVSRHSNQRIAEIGAMICGSFYVAILAQISIPLSFTPVPITGQTFAVATLALVWGSKRAFASFGIYLLEGVAGLPVFAQLESGIQMGPTTGYLLGMWLACWAIGRLSDCGAANTLGRALASCFVGSVCVFTFGLIGLSFYVPVNHLLSSGLFPFLPGDLIKNISAAIAVRALTSAKR